MSVTKVELFLNEHALGFTDRALASELFICTILDLHNQNLFVDARSRRVKQHCNLSRFPGRNHIRQWERHIDLAEVLPAESCRCVALVRDLENFLDGHLSVIAILTELEGQDL